MLKAQTMNEKSVRKFSGRECRMRRSMMLVSS